MNKETTLGKLYAFKQQEKFSGSAWEERGLNPSNDEISYKLQSLFNDCANNLIEAIKSDVKQNQIKRILKSQLGSLNSHDFETEEKEFICEYFNQLSKIVSIDLKDNLNIWQYGNVLNALFKVTSFFKGQDKIIETITQECTECRLKLETFVITTEQGIPDHSWTIIQCKNCNEYNLLSVGPNIKQYRFGNYQEIEQLPKAEYTEKQANVRLEQIKYFSKK